MKPKIEIEVEPLSPARWAKVEQGIFAELDRAPVAPSRGLAGRTRRHLALGLGAIAVAAAAAFLVVETTPQETRLASRIETGSVPSHVTLGTSTIDVAPQSAVVTSGSDRSGLLVVLEQGAVDCEVEPRAGRPPFVVLAGDVRVGVVGTRFTVRRDPSGVSVSVAHGTVEVMRGGQVARIRGGETWPPPSTEPPRAEPHGAESPPAEPPASEPSARSATTSPHRHASAAPVKPEGDQTAFERAASLEARDPDAAMVVYRRLGDASGPWAAPALFAAGRLAADRGRNGDAKALLGRYLARYPNGANAADARRLLERLP
jgi:hypothetical protein